jgi:hypothetical protein
VISVEDKIPSFKVIIRPWFKLADRPTQPGCTPKQLDLCGFTFAYIYVSFLFVLCCFYFLIFYFVFIQCGEMENLCSTNHSVVNVYYAGKHRSNIGRYSP